jgi:hypothetical protein
MKPLDVDEVDYNGGICEIGLKIVEDLLKPTVKNSSILVVNVWGNGNIIEVALVSSTLFSHSTPIGCQPIQLSINYI